MSKYSNFSGIKCLYTGLFLIVNHVLNDRFIDLANSAIIVSIAIMISIIAIGSFNNLLRKRASLQGKSDVAVQLSALHRGCVHLICVVGKKLHC